MAVKINILQVHCHAVSTPVNLASELLKGASSCVLFVLMLFNPFARNTCRLLPELAINFSGCDGRERPLKGVLVKEPFYKRSKIQQNKC